MLSLNEFFFFFSDPNKPKMPIIRNQLKFKIFYIRYTYIHTVFVFCFLPSILMHMKLQCHKHVVVSIPRMKSLTFQIFSLFSFFQ